MDDQVTVLFTESSSIYRQLNCDCWPVERNARLWAGGNPFIAHPPCRAFSRLKHFSNPSPGEKALAYLAINKIRLYGGVLEHPYSSSLWKEMSLPLPGTKDKFGGFTILINQSWFGYPCEKKTFIYICGVPSPKLLPPIPIRFDAIEYTVSSSKKVTGKKEISKKLRSSTPALLANWLLKVVQVIKLNQ